jgi:hypothetical protein
MTQTLSKPLVFQIKRFWNSLNPPSPLGWICVLTLTFGTVQITKNLIIRVLVMALYTIVFGWLVQSVKHLKKQTVDQSPTLEFRFWNGLCRRFVTSEYISGLLYVFSLISIVVQVIPLLAFSFLKVESIWLVLICLVIFAAGEFALVLHRWYDLDEDAFEH